MWTDIDIRKYKLIVFDVDGTLVEVKHGLDPFTRSVLQDIREYGIPFTLATGKNLKSTRHVVEELEIDLPLILANGSLMQSLDGTIHMKHLLEKGFVHQLIEVSEGIDLELAIHIGEDIYVREATYCVSILLDYGSPSLEAVGDWQAIEVLLPEAHKCIAINRENRQPLFDLEKKMHKKVGNTVSFCHTLPEMIEFMPRGITKMTGIDTLIAKMNIPIDSVMAFGDGNNDVEMLTQAGLGVAVENAVESAKACADVIVPACVENGPAQFLRYLMDHNQF